MRRPVEPWQYTALNEQHAVNWGEKSAFTQAEGDRYLSWALRNGNGDVLWDKWQRRLVTFKCPDSVWVLNDVVRRGCLRVVDVHDGHDYDARWEDLRAVDSPLEAIALAASAAE